MPVDYTSVRSRRHQFTDCMASHVLRGRSLRLVGSCLRRSTHVIKLRYLHGDVYFALKCRDNYMYGRR